MLRNLFKKKVVLGIIIIAVIAGGYYWHKSSKSATGEVRYVSAKVEKGTLISSVTGSGQITVSNQVDVKPKASGDLLSVNVKKGQEVKAGTILAQINASDQYKAIRDAQNSLDTTKLSLQKLLRAADPLTLMQSEDSLTQAQESKQTAQDNLNKSYEDGFNAVANAFLDLPDIMAGLNTILFANSFGIGQANLDYYTGAIRSRDEKIIQYRDNAYATYQTARTAYNKNFDDYKATSRYSDDSAKQSLMQETYDTTKTIAEAVKNTDNLLQFYKDKASVYSIATQPLADTHLNNLETYIGKTNTYLTSLLSALNNIVNYKQAIVSADRSIVEKTLSLADLKAGADPLDIRSSQLSVQQRESALADARVKLADYSIRAPFDGVIADLSVKKGDSVSAGAAVATLITKQKIAEISLNEVDVAKVKLDQKVTLTFDAISDLTISGQVIDIDTLGTVSQGVVSYSVKIGFDTQDDRVKPSMSVSASIITDVKQNVLLVANTAIKSSGATQYVQLLNGGNPISQEVVIGLANDSQSEVVNGLKEGDEVVTQTVTASSAATKSGTQQSGGIRIPGLGGGGGFGR